MSKIINYAKSAFLKVDSIEMDNINPIIFKTTILSTLPNLTKDGDKYYQLNTRNNTAIEISAKTIKAGALKAVEKGKDSKGYLAIAEDFGLIKSVKMTRDFDQDGGCTALTTMTHGLNMDVTEVVIDVQQDIIFKNRGIDELSDLTKEGKKFYKLDIKRNKAVVVNPSMVGKTAKKDLLAGDTTEFTSMVDDFNLISSITFVPAADED